MEVNRIIHGDALDVLRGLPDGAVDCVVTSPPYYGLRDYGVPGQIGLEPTPAEYVARMVAVFAEVRRVLADDGTAWVNIGDSYSAKPTGNAGTGIHTRIGGSVGADINSRFDVPEKNLLGIPWRLAFGLQDDGWILRSDIIWCLSGGAWVYARTQKGDMPMMIRDVARLDPRTVKLWNGQKWTQLLGMNKSPRRGDELEIVLRSGERISCTPTHRFPTQRGVIEASEISVGDILETCQLPEPDTVKDCAIDTDAAWFAGLYIAEGSRSGHTIQIAGHSRETDRWQRVQRIAEKFGGSATRTIDGNNMNIRVYGRVLHALIDELVTGRTASDKGIAPVVWRYSNEFLAAMIDGYLSGDSHVDGNRWRLGFTRNYNLERDLRTACARLGYTLTLNLSTVAYDGRHVPTFRGELRKVRSGHHNEKPRSEVVEIRKARCREVYDLGVQDEPHLFALASGVLTHNSKPNPMPESVRDRPTKSHEYVFMFAKQPRYWYDAEAISERAVMTGGGQFSAATHGARALNGHGPVKPRQDTDRRNARTVWHISTEPTPFAHFATMPTKLVRRCILAGCKPGGVVLDPFFGSGTTGLVARSVGRDWLGIELNGEYVALAERRLSHPYTVPMTFEETR